MRVKGREENVRVCACVCVRVCVCARVCMGERVSEVGREGEIVCVSGSRGIEGENIESSQNLRHSKACGNEQFFDEK